MERNIIDNRYVPIRELGSGGFATVIKAWATNLEKFVAVKRVHESFSNNARFLDMFRIEAINTAKLDHPNIVRVIDFLKTPRNIYYIIMEYVKGSDLRQLLIRCDKKKIRLPYQISAYIIGEVLKGLEFAYSHVDEISGDSLKIVHRDISPGNIMIYYDGRVKIGDFGIAKVSSALPESFDAGKLKGKVPYMSPEQAEGVVELDNRSDIFSVGVVMYELLAGKRLFEAKTEYDTWKMVRKVKFNPRSLDVLSDAPGPLKAILLKSLAKDRTERYQSSIEMLKDITGYLGAEEYNIQKNNLKKFLAQIFSKEIEFEDRETEHPNLDAELEDLNLHNKPSDIEPGDSQQKQGAPKPEEDEREKGEKTVIDFVLDTAKKYEKIFFLVSLAAVLVSAVFFIADVYFAWTPFGTKIHDKIWPPAMILESYPMGAEVVLKDESGRDVVPSGSLTPLRLEEISPGNYSLHLDKEGFNSISRRIRIIGSEINIDNTVRDESKANHFLIKMEAKLRINSNPPGASVSIDGKLLTQSTPIVQSIEAGKRLISLSLEGFDPLGSMSDAPSFGQCMLNLAEPVDQQNGIDRRFWELSKTAGHEGTTYTLTGTFWKKIDIDSNPQDADIYINNEQISYGKTPLSQVSFQVGTHTLRFELPGFKSESRTLVVDADTEKSISVFLNKIVKFSACGSDDPNNDINARITITGANVKNRVTPFEIDLPLKKLKAVFSKEPRYEPVTREFDVSGVSKVTASLKLRNPYLEIKVREERTLEPVSRATIILDGKYIGETDKNGAWKDYIPAGEHTIRIDTNNRFPVKEVMKYFEVAGKETLSIDLTAVADGVLIVDTNPHFTGAQIYVDGRFVGETFRKIQNVSRGIHKVGIRHFDFEDEITKTLNFDTPNKQIILKLNQNGEIIAE